MLSDLERDGWTQLLASFHDALFGPPSQDDFTLVADDGAHGE